MLSLRARSTIVAVAFLLLGATVSPTARAQKLPRTFELQDLSPKFWRLIDHRSNLTTVATGFGFTEGPVWDETGSLYVSDETLNYIFKVDVKSGQKQKVIALGDPDGNTYDRQRRILDCASVLRAVIRLSPDGKTYTIIADRYQGKRFNSPNDVVLGPDGAIYFTDPTSDLPKGQKQEIPFQGVYRISKSGNVTLLTKEIGQPNGLAFSPDGKKLYIDDDQDLNIRVYDFHPDGTISNGQIFGSEKAPERGGVPDGMRLDTHGNLYVVGPRGIWIWSPAGEHLGTIVVPEQPANLTWGDAGYSTLYITAGTSVYRIPTKVHGFIPYQ
ncbi:MAG TPA: SMP-30/gluconolactonase/LRE family protein [Acidobacteriaceae bacterium]|nr:SMP-30/gluconolactonase/LRE family protein [Acidobacteriaceae bacterium]